MAAPNVWLQHEPLNAAGIVNKVRSPKAGAIVTFAGTTRDSFEGKRLSSTVGLNLRQRGRASRI